MLAPGLSHEITFPVTEELTARIVGSGTLDVLATPVMIAKMEEAAWKAVSDHLEEGTGSVGILMNAQHLSATPVGMTVTCKAELTAVEGRKLVYKVSAWDEKGPIGEGIHERAVIQNERFVAKAYSKLEK